MNHGKLLKGKRFEQKPKVVKEHPDFYDHYGIKYHLQRRHQLYEIIDCIENGQPVPDAYYKTDNDTKGDRLLNEMGVKHLHIDGPGSDIIVYMAEYERMVELLEINTHVHLESEPRGEGLKEKIRGAAGVAVAAVKRKASKLKDKP